MHSRLHPATLPLQTQLMELYTLQAYSLEVGARHPHISNVRTMQAVYLGFAIFLVGWIMQTVGGALRTWLGHFCNHSS